MIDFSKYPRTKEMTYTVIRRRDGRHLHAALKISKEKDWQIRTCKVHDKSMIDDIKEHLPKWFDARYIVLISHFESDYIKNHLEEMSKDKDVNEHLAYESKIATEECMEHYRAMKAEMEEENLKKEK